MCVFVCVFLFAVVKFTVCISNLCADVCVCVFVWVCCSV